MSLDTECDEIILLLSSVKTVAISRSVCVGWNSLVTNPDFVTNHFNISTIRNRFSVCFKNQDIIKIIENLESSLKSESFRPYLLHHPFSNLKILTNFSHGVLCLSSSSGTSSEKEDPIIIWNPITKSVKKIRNPTIIFPRRFPRFQSDPLLSFSLGYDSVSDDLKLIRIASFGQSFDSEVRVYTVKSNKWKSILSCKYYLRSEVPGVYAGVTNSLYWLVRPCGDGWPDEIILRFNLSEENFEEVPQPSSLTKKSGIGSVKLCSLNDNLCFISYDMGITEISVMTPFGSWNQIASVQGTFESLKPIRVLNDKRILFEKNHSMLFVFDPTSEVSSTIEVDGIEEWFDAEAFVESFTLLKLDGLEAMALDLHASSTDKNAFKALVVGEHCGIKVNLVKDFEMGVSNKTPEFLKMNPLGKVPVLETPDGAICESNDIARYVACVRPASSLLEFSDDQKEQIDHWIKFSAMEIDANILLWVTSGTEFALHSPGVDSLKQALNVLNSHLASCTQGDCLVGDRVSLADIILICDLVLGFREVMSPSFTKEFPDVEKYFWAQLQLPFYQKVIGEVKQAKDPQAA